MTEANSPSLLPRWILPVNAVQFVFAIVILGFDAYGIKYIAYNALIFSLVTCLCTMAVAAYMIVSQFLIHKIYHGIVALALHIWLLIFWVIDLGLVANLAAMWGRGDYCYTSNYGFGSLYCLRKRALQTRDTTTFGTYYGVLAAGAVFAAVQLVLWALSTFVVVTAWNKQRSGASANVQANPAVAPQYQNNNGQAVPLEKYNQNPVPQPQQQQQFASPQPQYTQPAQPQYAGAPYAQDPVHRQETVSPVSHVGGYNSNSNYNVSEVGSTQHTGQHVYSSHASEVGSTQHTGQHMYSSHASEVHTDPYNPNVPELSNHK